MRMQPEKRGLVGSFTAGLGANEARRQILDGCDSRCDTMHACRLEQVSDKLV